MMLSYFLIQDQKMKQLILLEVPLILMSFQGYYASFFPLCFLNEEFNDADDDYYDDEYNLDYD